ncbi:uncharacterized protein LOC121595808 [Anopheles merus]|uniref:uncharacterized protein LOC121595808 n=1 Tax=Anopheles merus TaxID=30066 RepID=UPI001BE3D558|nr:uncharacterized protein LOC121595808 [Anopheles merus]XP_041775979.1 uncharacterized protein LOC121595808 [Anopheles merus]
MFRNRISVVRRAKNASKPNSCSVQSPLSSTNEGGATGDGPSSLAVELEQSGFSRASELVAPASPSSSVAADESIVMMEHGKLVEGICIDETAFTLDDSGEIRENELRLTVEDDNDVTKDLDFSRTSPALFSMTSPKRARMMLEMQRSIDRNRSAMTGPVSSSTPFLMPSVEGSGFGSSLKTTTQSEVSPAALRCSVDETPVPQNQQQRCQQEGQRTPWSGRSAGSQSKQAGALKRQSIAGAIDDLNEMTEELIDFIKGFEEKYSTAIH